MKTKKIFIITLSLALTLLLFNSCKRTAIDEPSPVGPSTFATLLNLSATPNVIFAGNSREITTITATLRKYTGESLANRTIRFEISNESGNKVNVGFFEGNESVKTKLTDSNGVARVNYYGPLSLELAENALIFITATLAGEGKEIIAEIAPLQIIADVTTLTFELIAEPNVLYATSQRPQSTIKALVKFGATPIANRKVYFTVLEGLGEFSDFKRKTYALTDLAGIASVIYVGPTKNEVAYDLFVWITAQPETVTPDYIHKEVPIRIIKAE